MDQFTRLREYIAGDESQARTRAEEITFLIMKLLHEEGSLNQRWHDHFDVEKCKIIKKVTSSLEEILEKDDSNAFEILACACGEITTTFHVLTEKRQGEVGGPRDVELMNKITQLMVKEKV